MLRSIPLLDQAALDAVRQWQFTPTLLNGVPVPVIMTVTVQVHAAVGWRGVRRSLRIRSTGISGQVEHSGRLVTRSAHSEDGRMNLLEMLDQMGVVAKAIAFVLFIMSMLVGRRRDRAHLHLHPGEEAVEAVRAAGGQAPQGRPPEGRHRAVLQARNTATATSPRSCSPVCRNTSSSRRAAAKLAATTCGHRAPLDSARHGADLERPQEGRPCARDHRRDGAVRRSARHGRRRHQRVRRHRVDRVGRHRRRLGRYRGSARRDRARSRSWPSRRCGSTTT